MYFKELYLQSFGQFLDQKFPFAPGINLVLGDNEAGKSTLLNCIYGIFFGFNNLKNLYQPWENQNEYRASLKFSDDSGDFSLERNFLNDEVIFLDGKTKFQAKIAPQGRRSERVIYFNKINELLGFSDPLLFRKTVFIGQGELSRKIQPEEGLKLKALLDGLSEHNYDVIVSELENKYFAITRVNPEGMHKRNNRILEEIREKKKALEEQLKTSEKAYKFIDQTKNEMAASEKELENLDKSKKTLENEKESLQEFLQLFEKDSSLSEKHESILHSQKKLQELKMKGEFVEKTIHLPYYYYFLPLLGLPFLFWWPAALALSVGLTAFLFIKWRETRKYHVEYIKIKSQIEILPHEDIVNKENSKLTKELLFITEKKKEICEKHPHFLSFKDTSSLKTHLLTAKQNLKKISEEFEIKRKKLQELKTALALYQKGLTPPSKLLEDMGEFHEQELIFKEKADSLYEAKKTLAQAMEEYRSSHLQRLSEEVSHIYSEVTHKKYNEVKIDEDFSTEVKKDSSLFSSSHLSFGAKDQLYFAIRFVFAKKLSHGRTLPFLLDDPFVHFDLKRQKHCCEILEDHAKKHQVIIVSHNKNYKNFFNKPHCIEI
ncbi:MAG TPA: AAA family ATPase [Bdellovibrionota bacterium]|nr:AAA family ATPase [Bdellovibrionota bacterium]